MPHVLRSWGCSQALNSYKIHLLQEKYTALLSSYTKDSRLIGESWNAITKAYSGKKRYYHNLSHLENMYAHLLSAKDDISDWPAVLLALFYHDFVYEPLRNDNEQKSTQIAETTLKKMLVPEKTIALCSDHILATKRHEHSSEQDTNYFIDADLSVLGVEWGIYLEYCNNIRKEYAVYPDIVYKPGRKKVLQHFLQMEEIFKTASFRVKLEEQARKNLQKELDML